MDMARWKIRTSCSPMINETFCIQLDEELFRIHVAEEFQVSFIDESHITSFEEAFSGKDGYYFDVDDEESVEGKRARRLGKCPESVVSGTIKDYILKMGIVFQDKEDKVLRDIVEIEHSDIKGMRDKKADQQGLQ